MLRSVVIVSTSSRSCISFLLVSDEFHGAISSSRACHDAGPARSSPETRHPNELPTLSANAIARHVGSKHDCTLWHMIQMDHGETPKLISYRSCLHRSCHLRHCRPPTVPNGPRKFHALLRHRRPLPITIRPFTLNVKPPPIRAFA